MSEPVTLTDTEREMLEPWRGCSDQLFAAVESIVAARCAQVLRDEANAIEHTNALEPTIVKYLRLKAAEFEAGAE